MIEVMVKSALDALGLPYEIMDCEPALADTDAFCTAYGIPPARSANTIVVVGKVEPRKYVACVVLATTRLDVNKTVRQRMGVKKASFADAEETADLTGMLIGGVTPYGLPPNVPIWVDARVMEPEWVVLGGGGRSTKVRTSPESLTRLGAEVIEGLAVPRE